MDTPNHHAGRRRWSGRRPRSFIASEVSSCVIHPNIEPGRHVVKGEELGHFQFGGSTHCLVFGPGVIGDFAMTAIPQPHDPDAPLVLVRSRLATVAPKAPSPAA
jgi:hypothetical protein